MGYAGCMTHSILGALLVGSVSSLLVPLSARGATHESYFWGISTDTPEKDPSGLSTEFVLGKRVFDDQTEVVVDDQVVLTQAGNLRAQIYRFDLKKQAVELELDGHPGQKPGKVESFRMSGTEVAELKYAYVVSGKDGYAYAGQDVLQSRKFPKIAVIEETGIVTSAEGARSHYSIVYYPIRKEEFVRMKSERFSSAKTGK